MPAKTTATAAETKPEPKAKAPAAEPQPQPAAAPAPAGYVETSAEDMRRVLDVQRQAFMAEGEVHYSTRIDRLNRCIDMLVNYQHDFAKAVHDDFQGRSMRFSRMGEVMTCIGTLKFVKKHLKKWMKPEKRRAPVPMNLLGARVSIHHQPKGVVGIMTPWNFPISMVFNPLADALGAGNRVMIKPSEFTPATSQLTAELFERYFEESEIAVCTGGPEVGAAFSALPLDHLIFTGATEIGRKVMQSAAPNLTPVTLELGGKSPVIIGESANIADAAEKIVMGKTMNAGQACVSPDYVFLPGGKVQGFVRNCRATFASLYPNVIGNPDLTPLVNKRHYDRINEWLSDARDKGCQIEEINPANETPDEKVSHRLPLYIVLEPKEDTMIMSHELFGPVLALRSYTDIEEVIDFINARPRPLALYYFGKNKAEERMVLNRTRSGGVCVNDVMMQTGCDDLPFGGTGASGIGNYHGIDGFRTFSHARSVFRQGLANVAKVFGTLPPYGDKIDKLIDSQIKK